VSVSLKVIRWRWGCR